MSRRKRLWFRTLVLFLNNNQIKMNQRMCQLKKGIASTLILSSLYMSILILGACVDAMDDPYPFGKCPDARDARVIDLNVYYAPYEDSRYALETDTVSFSDFEINLELIPEVISESSILGSLPGTAYALSCAATYNFKNISNISITLLEPFGGLEAGADISDNIIVKNNISLKSLEDFDNTFNHFRGVINLLPTNYDQLKTRTIITLKNGSKIVADSSSPYLKVN